jgi:ABC-type glutathione transport system ATPase component
MRRCSCGRDTSASSSRAPRLVRQAQFQAVRDATLQLKRGETLGIVGESGSGKTTLGMALLALQPIAPARSRSGRQRIDNAERSAARDAPAHAGRVPGSVRSLSPRMTIGQIVGEGWRCTCPTSRAERDARMLAMLDEVGLDERHGVATCCSAIRTSSPAASGSASRSRARSCCGPSAGARRADLGARRLGAAAGAAAARPSCSSTTA